MTRKQDSAKARITAEDLRQMLAEDRDLLHAHLVNAGEVKVVTLAGATHYAHLDRPERGRQALIDALTAFLLPGRR